MTIFEQLADYKNRIAVIESTIAQAETMQPFELKVPLFAQNLSDRSVLS
jgi:hypothetical protein